MRIAQTIHLLAMLTLSVLLFGLTSWALINTFGWGTLFVLLGGVIYGALLGSYEAPNSVAQDKGLVS